MQELVKKLEEKIPQSVVAEREGTHGKTLSYLEGWYIIDRLNQTIGHGNWSYLSTLTKLHEGKVEQRKGPAYYVSYSSSVHLRVEFPNGKICDYTDVGFGDGTDSTNPGKAHELAMKEAVTDGIKRAARVLGNSMGNGLYDKSGDGVSEDEELVPKTKVARMEPTPKQPSVEQTSLPKLLSQINATSKVILAQGSMTIEQIRDLMRSKYSVDEKEKLSYDQATEFKVLLTEKTKEVK